MFTHWDQLREKDLVFHTSSSLLSSMTVLSVIYYYLNHRQGGKGIAPKYQWWKLADKVTQLAITRLFQSARQFIFSVNVSFHNSSLTHKLYLSRIFQGLKWSPSSAMLNDLWNNLIMMSCWHTDLSQEWSHVMDMSTALVTGEKGVRDEVWRSRSSREWTLKAG